MPNARTNPNRESARVPYTRTGKDLEERGNYSMTLEHSAYTAARRHPVLTTAVVAGTTAAVYGYLRNRHRPHP